LLERLARDLDLGVGENKARNAECLEELNKAATESDDLEERSTSFLATFVASTLHPVDSDRNARVKGKARLMTLHGSKGLEWNFVFLPCLTQESLPHRLSIGDKKREEEERRLFYVGITRAKR
jgi:DNA helicase II / ATP-dependent DNA helicase PcrA